MSPAISPTRTTGPAAALAHRQTLDPRIAAHHSVSCGPAASIASSTARLSAARPSKARWSTARSFTACPSAVHPA
jgi:hypothetical protein